MLDHDIDFESVFNSAVKDTLTQIDLFESNPIVNTVTLFIRPYSINKEYLDPPEIFVMIAVFNHFLGVFEGICVNYLQRKYNFSINISNKHDYVDIIRPYFKQITKRVTKIPHETYQNIWKNSDHNIL